MLESLLHLQVIRRILEFLRLVGQLHLAAFVLRQIPQSALDRHLRQLDRLRRIIAPARRARRRYVDDSASLDLLGLRDLCHVVLRIRHRRCRHIRDAVRAHDLEQALSELVLLALRARSCRGRRRPRVERGRSRSLHARVHVRFVVVADVDQIIVSLRSARKTLQTDVDRAAVAGDRQHRIVVVPAERLHRVRHAGRRRSQSRERADRVVHEDRGLREHRRRRREAARRGAEDRLLSEDLEGHSGRHAGAATLADLCPVEQFLIVYCFQIDCHSYHLNPKNWTSSSSPPFTMLNSLSNISLIRALETSLPPSPTM